MKEQRSRAEQIIEGELQHFSTMPYQGVAASTQGQRRKIKKG
jgi:hypothetical protein